MKIDFGPYRPDLPDIQPGYSSNIKNALPIAGASGIAYAPMPGLSVLSGAQATATAPRGGVTAVKADGTYKAYIATASKIHDMDAIGALTEIGTGYSLPSDDYWSGFQFGDYLLMANKTDGVLQYDIENGGSVTSVTNAPTARFIFEAFDSVFALDCDGNNQLMQNSTFNDHTEWTKGVAGKKEFPTGQELIAGSAVSNQVAIVLQKNAVRRLTRTSDRYLYTTDTLAEGIGAASASSVVTVNGMMFFWDTDGAYMTSGGQPVPIGSEKINRTFLNKLGTGEIKTVQGAADPTRQMIFWRYRSNTVTSENVFENILAYSWKLDEFVEMEVDTSFLVTMASPGYNLDNIDSFGDADTAGLPKSDDAFWSGGEPVIGALDENYKFGFFNGGNLAATLETNKISSARQQLYRSVLPNTDSANATVEIGVADSQSDSLTYSTAVGIEASGRAPVRARGKVSSLRLNIPAAESWESANGFSDVQTTAGGAR
ncbi:hypothetical protein JY97_00685 [Alkalispirochaeta odontotermitis]|nr:hypothetical protein JY97_00685 [Alkalispirochaeta odontotermitis]